MDGLSSCCDGGLSWPCLLLSLLLLLRDGMIALMEAGLRTSGEAGGTEWPLLLLPPTATGVLLRLPSSCCCWVWLDCLAGVCCVLLLLIECSAAAGSGLLLFAPCFLLVIVALLLLLAGSADDEKEEEGERGEPTDERRLSDWLDDDEDEKGELDNGDALADDGGDER